jgi:hypothetical protein
MFFFEDFFQERFFFFPHKTNKKRSSFAEEEDGRRRSKKKKCIIRKKMASSTFNFDELAKEALSSQREEEMKTDKETKKENENDWQNHPMFWEKGENGNCEDWFDENSDEFQALKALLHDDDD